MSWYPWVHPNLTADPNGRPRRRLEDAIFYSPSQPLRPLRILIDASLRFAAKNDPKIAYLLQLLAHPSIESMFFSQDGSHRSTTLTTYEDTGETAAEDWVWIDSDKDCDNLVVHYWKDLLPRELRISKDNLPSFSEGTGKEYWRIIGDRINCDLLVMNAGAPHRTGQEQWGRVTILETRDALPIVGLYLRCQNQFISQISPPLGHRAGQRNIGRSSSSEFYLKAAGLFLPAASRGPSSHRAVFTTSGSNDYRRAAMWRMQQALQYRDKLLQELAVAPRDHLSSEHAAELVEIILMWLMAAFDVTARLVQKQFGKEPAEQRPSWQTQKWRNSLCRPDLAGFFRGDTEAGATLTIINQLRNMIHGSNPISEQGISFFVGLQAMQCFLSVHHLDQSEYSKLANAFERLGGAADWEAELNPHTRTLQFHPGKFIERLLPLAVSAINGSLEIEPDMQRRASAVGGPYELQLHEKKTLWQMGFCETDVPER